MFYFDRKKLAGQSVTLRKNRNRKANLCFQIGPDRRLHIDAADQPLARKINVA
jgi:hypothetical protein